MYVDEFRCALFTVGENLSPIMCVSDLSLDQDTIFLVDSLQILQPVG
jgi:hypothetical protein